jgi:hypothetical protein
MLEPSCSLRTYGRTDGQTDRQTEGRTDRPTDMTKVIVAFRSYANAPNNWFYLCCSVRLSLRESSCPFVLSHIISACALPGYTKHLWLSKISRVSPLVYSLCVHRLARLPAALLHMTHFTLREFQRARGVFTKMWLSGAKVILRPWWINEVWVWDTGWWPV